MSDKKLILSILEDLQNLFENNEKKVNEKSAFTYAAAKASVSGKKEFTFKGEKHPVKMSKEKAKKIVNETEKNDNIKEFLSIMKEYVDESESLDEKKKKRAKHIKPTKGETEYRAKKYNAPPKSKRAKGLAKAASLYKQGKTKQAAAVRQRMEKGERKKKSFKNVPRSDTRMAENMKINLEVLREYIEEEFQLAALNKFIAENNHLLEPEFEKELFETNDLDEKRKRKKRKKKKKKSGKSPKGLSAAVKKSLDKKADKRGLTRGSVYAEFRKGLAAFLSSGSRKGMSAHQWAHARVNSANPSKSWASVKKKKGGKKKK
tara:strand:+ start:436 stop:1389 length:954 start_codon:yes stop_codon:yes gene_type:complete